MSRPQSLDPGVRVLEDRSVGGGLSARELLLVDTIAERVLEMLRQDGGDNRNGGGLVSAAEVARELGMSRAYVYEHASELGAQRLGDGPRARLRFDLEAAREALIGWNGRHGSERSEAPIASTGAGSRPSAQRGARRGGHYRPQPGAILRSRPPRRATTGTGTA
jgi:hypothetical protein